MFSSRNLLIRTAASTKKLAPLLESGGFYGNIANRQLSYRWFSSVEETASFTKITSDSTGPSSPKVQKLVEDILQLNMIEVRELTDQLKGRLGVSDLPVMAAPMMAPNGMGGQPGSDGSKAKEEAPKKEEKTEFALKLESYDAAKKIQVIKEVRALAGLGLKEAKELVEGAPKIIKTGFPKEEAEKLRDKLKELGANVVLE
eukprot:jgi/Galph1/4321/GphlegSOOS_G2971.1